MHAKINPAHNKLVMTCSMPTSVQQSVKRH